MFYLAADSEERVATGIHEKDLTLIAFHVIIDPENQVTFRIEHREAITVEKQ